MLGGRGPVVCLGVSRIFLVGVIYLLVVLTASLDSHKSSLAYLSVDLRFCEMSSVVEP